MFVDGVGVTDWTYDPATTSIIFTGQIPVAGAQIRAEYVAAARFYAEAFKAEPKHADSLRGGHRYNAACAAALAIAQVGDKRLSDDERKTWLKQARTWLQADLDAWTKLLDQNPKAAPIINKTLKHWLPLPCTKEP